MLSLVKCKKIKRFFHKQFYEMIRGRDLKEGNAFLLLDTEGLQLLPSPSPVESLSTVPALVSTVYLSVAHYGLSLQAYD